MIVCSISLVELDTPVLNVEPCRSSVRHRKFPVSACSGFSGKECIYRLLFSPNSADGATINVLAWKKGMSSPTKNDSSGHKSIDGHQLYSIWFKLDFVWKVE
jgi:hypothetical protein